MTTSTDQPSKVKIYTEKLDERLKAEGSLPLDAIKGWLADEGLEARQINFVLGQGMKKGANKWHQEMGHLVPGPKSPEMPPVIDPMVMDQPKDQFNVMARQIGVTERAAEVAANYLFANYDMTDPRKAWEGLQRTQIAPGLKKSVWQTWMNLTGAEVPSDLAARIQNAYAPRDLLPESREAPSGPVSRRWIAVEGEVMEVEPGDPGGMSHTQALLQARLQVDKLVGRQEPRGGSDALMIAILTDRGETERARINLEATREAPGTGLEARIESQRREFESKLEVNSERMMGRLEAMQERHELAMERLQEGNQHAMEIMSERHGHALDLLNRSIDALSGRRGSLSDTIEEALGPSLGANLLQRLLVPPESKQDQLVVKLGDGQTIPLDSLERLTGMQMKQQAMGVVREHIGDFIETAKDLIAERKAERAAPPLAASPATEPKLRETQCAECGHNLVHRAGMNFLCPLCGALQTPAGVILERPQKESTNEEKASPEQGQVATPPALARRRVGEWGWRSHGRVPPPGEPMPEMPNSVFLPPEPPEVEERASQVQIPVDEYFIRLPENALPATEVQAPAKQEEVIAGVYD